MSNPTLVIRSSDVVLLTSRLLALATEQRDVLRRGTVQQLAWLSDRMDDVIADLRAFNGSVALDPADLTELRALAAELEKVRQESEQALDESPPKADPHE